MPSALLRPWRPAVAAAVLSVTLAGCGSSTKLAPVCPQLSLLEDAADLTRFSGPVGTPRDARSLMLAAGISAVPAKCGLAGKSAVEAVLHVEAQMRRGPAASGDTAQVPYFVAITEGDHVLTEQDFVLGATFRPNVDQVAARGQDITLTFPISKTKTAAAYHIYIGFRLTAEELAYNRETAQQ